MRWTLCIVVLSACGGSQPMGEPSPPPNPWPMAGETTPLSPESTSPSAASEATPATEDDATNGEATPAGAPATPPSDATPPSSEAEANDTP